MKQLFLLWTIFCLAPFALADKYIAKGDDTAIISNVCLYDATDGVNKITNVDSEDAGLKITLTSSDHATLQVYDVVGEIEPITTFGTWLAPTAVNVRFEADPTTGCYEFQFLANSFENGVTANLAIEDTSSPTFMDRDVDIQIWAKAFFDIIDGTTSVLTSLCAGAVLCDTSINSVTSTTIIVVDGYTNNNVAIGSTVFIKGGTEADTATVCDFDNGTLTYDALNDCSSPTAISFTVFAGDELYIYPGAAGDRIDGMNTDQKSVLVNTGTTLPGEHVTAQASLDLLNGTFLNCEVNTANFAGSTSTFACILTDLSAGAVTQASNDLEGLQIVVTSGAQIREARFINDTTWDGANSELQMTLSRALPATLADAVTVIVR